jgi:hypothetical protein
MAEKSVSVFWEFQKTTTARSPGTAPSSICGATAEDAMIRRLAIQAKGRVLARLAGYAGR